MGSVAVDGLCASSSSVVRNPTVGKYCCFLIGYVSEFPICDQGRTSPANITVRYSYGANYSTAAVLYRMWSTLLSNVYR